MPNKFLTILFIFSLFFSTQVLANPDHSVKSIFKLEENLPNKTFLATLTIKNNSPDPIRHWQLAFNFIRTVQEVDSGTLSKPVGDFYIFTPTNQASIPAKGEYIIHLRGKWHIKHITDAPAGYFFILNANKTIAVENEIRLPLLSKNKIQHIIPQASPIKNAGVPHIIPLPVSIQTSESSFIFNKKTLLFVDQQAKSALSAAKYFNHSIAKAMGFNLTTRVGKSLKTPKNVIHFILDKNDERLGNEGYVLESNADQIQIRARGAAGFFYATQTLRQLLPPENFSNQTNSTIAWSVPAVKIIDYPRFSYRGIVLDVARHFFSTQQVKRFIDLMALHKLNTLQLHLTDDEGWRLEIKKYPSLTSIGAWRGFQWPLLPAYGSGPKLYGGYYSQNDIRELIEYAKARHITIIPEIDIPGHARALIKSLPDQLVDPHDQTSYTSAQGYHDNVISPCSEKTYQVLSNIFSKVAQLFPSSIIHVGSDEIPSGAWSHSPQCAKWMAENHLNKPTDLHSYFLKRIQKIIHAQGKKMAIWDDALKNQTLDQSTVVYSWTSENAGFQAVKKGYSVVLMPAAYLYFDLAYNQNPDEPGYYWAGLVDPFKIYSYHPVQSNWSQELIQKVIGIQGALWTENISSEKLLDYFAFPKLLALAEVAWTPEEKREWNDFSKRMNQSHLHRLDQHQVAYRH